MSESHLIPAAIEALNIGTDERIAWLKRPRWIGYTRAQTILRKLEDLHDHPREARMPNMLVIGASNSGKTKLVKQFASNHPVHENPGGEFIFAPVLYVQAPPSASEASLYSEILGALYERVPNGSTDVKRDAAVRVLKGVQTKVLIIDEMHNILAGTTIRQQQVLNAIKYLCNGLQISIVGCGTGDLLRAVSIDPQIQNRFPPELLSRWQFDKEYRRLLMSFERVLPLKIKSELHSETLGRKIFAMTEGTIGELSLLLNAAAIRAIQCGQEKIDLDVLNECGYVSPSDRTKQAAFV